MNASWRATASRGSPPAIARAEPTESWAWASAAAGSRPNRPSARCAAYTEENSEPTTATPRVPPSSRVASFTADPTPARAGGSTSRIDSVAGVEIRPMPRPISTICGTITVGVRRVDGDRRDPQERQAEEHQAGRHDHLGADPRRQHGADHRGDGDAQRHRQDPGAGGEGAVAADELEVLRDQEDEPEQREEGDRHRAAGRAEPAVAEQRHVEHRVRRTPLARRRRRPERAPPRRSR